eukprot:s4749_g4.t1
MTVCLARACGLDLWDVMVAKRAGIAELAAIGRGKEETPLVRLSKPHQNDMKIIEVQVEIVYCNFEYPGIKLKFTGSPNVKSVSHVNLSAIGLVARQF